MGFRGLKNRFVVCCSGFLVASFHLCAFCVVRCRFFKILLRVLLPGGRVSSLRASGIWASRVENFRICVYVYVHVFVFCGFVRGLGLQRFLFGVWGFGFASRF